MYGIRNCDTIKKARAWMDAHAVEYQFHDYKTSGIDRGRLERWCGEHGWEAVCNRAGATFRNLSGRDKSALDERTAIALMLEQPSMIKRPIVEAGEQVLVGFSPAAYQRALHR
jgi:arsenate reductase